MRSRGIERTLMVPLPGSTCIIFTESLRCPGVCPGAAPVWEPNFPVMPTRESEPISRMLNGSPEIVGSSPATFIF